MRRAVGSQDVVISEIKPVQPSNELRDEAIAAPPPVEKGEYCNHDLVQLVTLDPTLKLYFRDATKGASGLRHHRGCKVDSSLDSLAKGHTFQMIAGYDGFSAQ